MTEADKKAYKLIAKLSGAKGLMDGSITAIKICGDEIDLKGMQNSCQKAATWIQEVIEELEPKEAEGG